MQHSGTEISAITGAANKAAGEGAPARVRFNPELTDIANHGQPLKKYLVILTAAESGSEVIKRRFPVSNLSDLIASPDHLLQSHHQTNRVEIERAMLHLMKNPTLDVAASQEANKGLTDPEKIQIIFSDPAVNLRLPLSPDRLLTHVANTDNSSFKPEVLDGAVEYMLQQNAAVSKAAMNKPAAKPKASVKEMPPLIEVMTTAGLPVRVSEAELARMQATDNANATADTTWTVHPHTLEA